MSDITDENAHEGQATTSPDEFFNNAKAHIKAGQLSLLTEILSEWRYPPQDKLKYLVSLASAGDGKPDILEYLLSTGAEINTYAVGQASSPTMFEIFISHGWQPTPSILNKHLSNPTLVSLFLNNGVPPNGSNPNTPGSFTPLERASLHAPLETLEILLDHGASIDSSPGALHAAAQGDAPDRIAIMQFLLEEGADIDAFAADIPAPSEARRSGRKGTALHTAYKWGFEEGKKWLLEHGANPGIRNQVGETPEEWGRRFDSDGPERGVRLRRRMGRKGEGKKKDEGDKEEGS